VVGEVASAQRCHRLALELSRDMASFWDEAHALAGLGRCALATGRPSEGKALLQQALGVFQRIGAAETPELLEELNALTTVP
jgi:hypothetical protein